MLNRAILAKVFDPLDVRLKDHLPSIVEKFPAAVHGKFDFPVFLYPSGQIRLFDPHPFTEDRTSRFALHVLQDVSDDWLPGDDNFFAKIELQYDVTILPMTYDDGRWSAYHVQFHTASDDPSFDQFWNGYIGITKRAPLGRFREHSHEAMSGRGSVLHRAWRALHNSDVKYHPILTVFGTNLRTLDEAYEVEESMVDKWTLNPRGFNAIPGGYAGIRMMHELRLLPSAHQVQPSDRDAALERLLSRQRGRTATHFRSGHIRKLHGGERTTWVRSCWINLDPAALAA